MTNIDVITGYLDSKGVKYVVHEVTPFQSVSQAASSAGIAQQDLLQVIPLRDPVGLMMAVIPASHSLSLRALAQQLGRKLGPALVGNLARVFSGCDLHFIPPLGELYKVRMVADEAIKERRNVYILAGDSRHLVQLRGADFLQLDPTIGLCDNATRAKPVAQPNTVSPAVVAEPAVANDIRARLKKLTKLPAMPQMAQRIIQLKGKPDSHVKELAEIIELDPSLAAQVMRYAVSPFFGYRGKVESVQVAIARVLGYDLVMNLALGIAASKPFSIPRSGPLGLAEYWRHAVYSASLAQALSNQLPAENQPPVGLVYLAGLLHNFGHLLIGHLLKTEFMQLSNRVSKEPEKHIVEIEKEMFGMDHGELGAWLLTQWGLPEEITTAVRHHHHEDFNGMHAIFANLTLVSDRLLKRHGIGEAPDGTLPPAILGALELSEYQVVTAMNRVLDGCEGLETMAQRMAS